MLLRIQTQQEKKKIVDLNIGMQLFSFGEVEKVTINLVHHTAGSSMMNKIYE